MYFASSSTVCFPFVCYQFQQMCIQPCLILHQGYIPEKVAQIKHIIPIPNSAFPGGCGNDLILYSLRLYT